MKDITLKDIKDAFDLIEKVTDAAEIIGENIHELKFNKKPGYLEGLESWDEDQIVVQFGTSLCGCCADDYTMITFPTSYLWDPEYLSKEKFKLAEEVKKQQAERKIQEAQDKAALELSAYKEYVRLKRKFE